jgi:hypothetical protein
MCGFAVSTEPEGNSRVWPSGADFAASSAPMLPPAPARLSMTTVCPQASPSWRPSSRATMSVAPPGENGTMMRTGRLGNSACATPEKLAANTTTLSNMPRQRVLRSASVTRISVDSVAGASGGMTNNMSHSIEMRECLRLSGRPLFMKTSVRYGCRTLHCRSLRDEGGNGAGLNLQHDHETPSVHGDAESTSHQP